MYRYTLCSPFKPSSAGDSKTTVGTYAAVIHTLHYYTPFAHCLWRSTVIYVQYRYDDFTLSTTTSRLTTLRLFQEYSTIPRMPLTIVTVLMPFYKSDDTLWWFRGHFYNSADILRRFRRKIADYRHGDSADFVKYLVMCTVATMAQERHTV